MHQHHVDAARKERGVDGKAFEQIRSDLSVVR
jgi:hypothetical protein